MLRYGLWLRRREGRTTRRDRRRRRPRKGVGDGVQEGTHQPFRIGQQRWFGARHRHGVRLRRHRGGQFTHALQVLRAQRAGAPDVMVLGREPGQQQPASGELEGEDGGRAPERGRPVGVCGGTRAREDRQGVPHRQQQGGYGHGFDASALRGQDHCQVLGGAGRHDGRPVTRRMPERDAART